MKKTRHYSGPECLEARIAPAGLVTATLNQGALTLAGGVDATDFLIQQVDSKTWALTGSGGTLITYNGAAAASLVFIKGVSGDVALTFGNNADRIIFDRVNVPKNVTANLGDGLNLLGFLESRIGGSFSYTGGAGTDSLSFVGEKITVGRGLTANLGNGTGTFGFTSDAGSIGGDLTVTGGNSLQLTGGSLKVKGNLLFDAGSAGTTSISTTVNNLEVGKDMTITDSNTGNVVNVSPAVSFKVGGKLTVNGGAGLDTLNIGVGTVRLSVGALEAITAADGDADKVNVTPSGSLTVKGDLTLTSNGGGITNVVSADVVRIGRDFITATTAGGAMSVDSRISALTELTVGRSIVIGSAADLAFGSVISGGRLKVGNNVYFANTGALTSLAQALQGDIGGTLSANANTVALLDLNGTALRVKGDVLVNGPTGAALDADLASFSIGHDLRTLSSSGGDTVDVKVARIFSVGHDVALNHQGTSFDAQFVVGSGRIGGMLQIDASATGNIIQKFTGELGKLTIGGKLDLVAAASGNGETNLTNVSVGGNTAFSSGSGTDTVRINDSSFAGTVTMSMGGNADNVLIEQVPTLTRGSTLFKSNVSINLDSGNDLLFVGLATDFYRVAFKKTVTFNGGTETDMATIAAAPYVIFPTGQPTVTGFE